MKINLSPIYKSNNQIFKKENETKTQNPLYKNNFSFPNTYSKNYYFLNFTAQISKDLSSFEKRNLDKMPKTLQTYLCNLSEEEKAQMTPLEAQREAFEYLSICSNVNDIKDLYPDEPLFENLKSFKESKATSGFLYEIRLMQDALEEDNEDLLISEDDDLCVWLVKEIFLEGKTREEINDDLDSIINPVFKKEDKNYIATSTFSSLGIQLPKKEYLTSLRYTREGYSDKIGGKISESLKGKIIKRKPLTQEQLDLLSKEAKRRWDNKTEEEKAQLSQNAKKRWEDLSEEEKQRISDEGKERWKNLPEDKKESFRQKQRENWEKMSPEQKTERIEKMQTGSEKAKITLFAAWNEMPEEREKLSEFLIKNNMHSVQSIIYRDNSYSPAMKIIMNHFWAENKDIAQKLGDNISKMSKIYDKAQEDGKLDDWEKSVIKKRDKIKAEIKAKAKKPQKTNKVSQDTNTEAIENYKIMFSFLPERFLEKQCEQLEQLSKKDIELFTKYSKGERLNKKEIKIARKIEEKVVDSSDKYFFYYAMLQMLNEKVAPLKNTKTNEEFKPPILELDTQYSTLTKIYFEIKKKGFENINLFPDFAAQKEDGSRPKNLYETEITDIFNKAKPDSIICKDLMESYSFNLTSPPDFNRVNELYNSVYDLILDDKEFDKRVNKFCKNEVEKIVLNISKSLSCVFLSDNFSDFTKYDILMAFKKQNINSQIFQKPIEELSNQEKNYLRFLEDESESKINKEEKAELIKTFNENFSFLPEDFLKKVENELALRSKDEIKNLTKYLKGEKLDSNSIAIAKSIIKTIQEKNYSESQALIMSAISVFDECLCEVKNKKNGEKFKPMFPHIDFYFEDIVKLCYKIEHEGYESIDLIDYAQEKGNFRFNGLEDDALFQEVLKESNISDISCAKKYRYKLTSKPDFKKLKTYYDKMVNTKITEKEIKECSKKIGADDLSYSERTFFENNIRYNSPIYQIVMNDEYSSGAKLRMYLKLKNVTDSNYRLIDYYIEKYKNDILKTFS